MKKLLLFVMSLAFAASGFSQRQSLIPPIQWFSFENALLLNAERAAYGLPTKKIFVHVYTTWCGPCRQMDINTFTHPVIADMLNTDWIPVKLNAERTDTIIINEQMFVNENPGVPRASHQLAQVILQGQMGYPTLALIDEAGRPIQNIPGYKSAPQLEMLLRFFSSDAYKTTEWEEFQKTFQGLIK